MSYLDLNPLWAEGVHGEHRTLKEELNLLCLGRRTGGSAQFGSMNMLDHNLRISFVLEADYFQH